jgi:hypothetical protein
MLSASLRRFLVENNCEVTIHGNEETTSHLERLLASIDDAPLISIQLNPMCSLRSVLIGLAEARPRASGSPPRTVEVQYCIHHHPAAASAPEDPPQLGASAMDCSEQKEARPGKLTLEIDQVMRNRNSDRDYLARFHEFVVTSIYQTRGLRTFKYMLPEQTDAVNISPFHSPLGISTLRIAQPSLTTRRIGEGVTRLSIRLLDTEEFLELLDEGYEFPRTLRHLKISFLSYDRASLHSFVDYLDEFPCLTRVTIKEQYCRNEAPVMLTPPRSPVPGETPIPAIPPSLRVLYEVFSHLQHFYLHRTDERGTTFVHILSGHPEASSQAAAPSDTPLSRDPSSGSAVSDDPSQDAVLSQDPTQTLSEHV